MKGKVGNGTKGIKDSDIERCQTQQLKKNLCMSVGALQDCTSIFRLISIPHHVQNMGMQAVNREGYNSRK
jgi:hypothetical protein